MRRQITGVSALALGIGVAAAGSAAAQQLDEEGTTRLDEIMVLGASEDPTGPVEGYRAERSSSGTKLDLDVDEVPFSLQVVPRDVIRDSNANRVEDAVLSATGASVGNTFGGINEAFILRGFRAEVADNGALVSAAPVRRRDSANVERIEVLSGPSGAFFGLGPPGGVINVITKAPLDGEFFESRSTVSSLFRLRQEVDWNLPISETWNTNARVVAALEGTNSFRYRDFFDSTFPENRQLIAPSIAFEPIENLSVVMKFQYQRDEVVFDRGIPIDPDGEPLSDIDDFFGDEEFSDFSLRQIIGDLEIDYALNDDWSVTLRGVFDDDVREGFSVEPERVATVDVPLGEGPFPIDVVAGETILRQLEFRDQGARRSFGRLDLKGSVETGPLEHTLLLSVDGQVTSTFAKVQQTGIVDAVPINAPGTPTVLTPDDFRPQTFTQTDLDIVSFSFFDQISWGDRVHLLGGGRVDILNQTNTFFTTDILIEETEFSPRVGLVVKPVPSVPVSVFFSYGESFEPNLGAVEGGGAIDPQTGRTFEGGLHFDLFDEALGLTFTVFDIELVNVPVSTGGFFVVGSDQRSRGFEVLLQGAVTPNFDIIANYTFTDNELTRVDPGGLEPALGEALAGVPRHAFSLLGTYSFDSGTLQGLEVTGGLRYRGRRLASNTTRSLDAIEFDGFVDVDISARYSLTEAVELEAGISNLLNQDILRGNTGSIAIPEPGIEGFAGLTVRF
ncbi:MAG: TonB-dependent receptor [Myxococcota bacterium]